MYTIAFAAAILEQKLEVPECADEIIMDDLVKLLMIFLIKLNYINLVYCFSMNVMRDFDHIKMHRILNMNLAT